MNASQDAALANLHAIKHIVVVMMENRSFDHLLGYLKHDGLPEVDGLEGTEYNLGPDHSRVPVTAFDADASAIQRPGEALQKKLDPDHSKKGVAVQLGPGYGNFSNGGFVKDFVETRNPEDQIGQDSWVVPMGHYTAKDLPTYDHLARTYCVCDQWHASVPGDTWPNRLYALTGQEGPKVHPRLLERLEQLIGRHALKALEGAPIYDLPAFTRHLDETQWRWYSHDPATLRAVDSRYRRLSNLQRENFAFFDRKRLSVLTESLEAPIVGGDSFLDDAANGTLRSVSWIDPNFIDLSVLDPNSNDDHPPSDVRAGQAFILDVYDALRHSPGWQDTLLVVVYDEHGGFYDHVAPPAVDDASGYRSLGLRVPALLVGPRVRQDVCHQLFQHTSLINTILTRFASDPAEAIRQMPARVGASQHLGITLLDEPRQGLPAPDRARAAIESWRTGARARRQARPKGRPSVAPDGAGQPLVLHDFQAEFLKFAVAMRHAGLPVGQP
jgi:phospholipase C